MIEKLKHVSISDRESLLISEYMGINRLTDECMNKTLTDFISEIDFFSDRYFSRSP